jgi:probable F420-dependent oxidoreductase
MDVGINLMAAERMFCGDLSAVFDFIGQADRRGVDLISTSDHLGFNAKAHADREVGHGFPFVLDQPWYEPISLLSAAAAVTKRVRLSTFVLIAPLRPTLLLAKQLATLDQISNGRVIIGLGVGWQPEEFAAAGAPFEGRFGHLVEMIEAFRALWGPPPANYKGKTFHFEDFYALPPPAQGARLPVLIGLTPTPRNLERIAQVADGWAVNPADLGSFREHVVALRKAFAAQGRDPDTLEVHVGPGAVRGADGALDFAATKASALTWADAGATTLSFRAADFCRSAQDVDRFFDFLADVKKSRS